MSQSTQFFPTPKPLAMRAWRKFQNPDFGRVLEPSAGEGHLACARPSLSAHRIPEVDCIEIDITKHDVLRAKGFRVVGVDFLQYRDAAMYAHIIMNPPFAEGVRHILYAWNLLWDGEIVALLNAESIRNPFSKERRQLTRLIERYGNVEFAEGAFLVPDAEHKTAVDVAICVRIAGRAITRNGLNVTRRQASLGAANKSCVPMANRRATASITNRDSTSPIAAPSSPRPRPTINSGSTSMEIPPEDSVTIIERLPSPSALRAPLAIIDTAITPREGTEIARYRAASAAVSPLAPAIDTRS